MVYILLLLMDLNSNVHQQRSRPPCLRPEVVRMKRSSGSPLMMELLLPSLGSFTFQFLDAHLKLLLLQNQTILHPLFSSLLPMNTCYILILFMCKINIYIYRTANFTHSIHFMNHCKDSSNLEN